MTVSDKDPQLRHCQTDKQYLGLFNCTNWRHNTQMLMITSQEKLGGDAPPKWNHHCLCLTYSESSFTIKSTVVMLARHELIRPSQQLALGTYNRKEKPCNNFKENRRIHSLELKTKRKWMMTTKASNSILKQCIQILQHTNITENSFSINNSKLMKFSIEIILIKTD